MITIDDKRYAAELVNNKINADLENHLPLEIDMSTWGNELYGALDFLPEQEDAQQEIFAVGELGYWPPGNAFCFFYGRTPASTDERPRMASSGISLGHIIEGDISSLKRGVNDGMMRIDSYDDIETL